MLSFLSNSLIPSIVLGIILYGTHKRINVFSAFIIGVKEGLNTVFNILPTLIGLLTAVYMLRSSGAIDMIAHTLSPVLSFLGIPEQCAPLVLLKPLSGGGGLAIGTEIIKSQGVDSLVGTIAAVMLAASETSIYTISMYFGYLKLNNTRYAIPAALCADLVAFCASAFFTRLFF